MRAIHVAGVCMVAFGMTRAKDTTRKLVITGESFAGPVEITDGRTLALSDVFTGNFFDSARVVAPPDRDAQWFEVSFYLPNDSRASILHRLFGPPAPPLARAYVISLAVDTVRHLTSVYLPGAGDAWTAWNHGTIVRKTLEGVWHPAAASWGAAVEQAIARARRRPPPSCAGAVGPAVVHAGDPVYRDIAEIVDRMDQHDVNVMCVYWSTLDGMFGSARTLGVMTRLGALAVFTFANADRAAAPLLSTSVVQGQLMTTVSVPGRERPDSVFGADRNDFVRYDRWVIDTFQQPALRAAVREALFGASSGSRGSPEERGTGSAAASHGDQAPADRADAGGAFEKGRLALGPRLNGL